MDKIPEQLRKKQEIQRQNTINLVLRAISELTAEGYSIKIKDLMEHTGLSRSVFAKPHIRQVLVSYGVIKVQNENMDIAVHSKKPSSRNSNLRDKLKYKDARITELLRENEALQSECFLLRGRLFLLMQRMDAVKQGDPNDT